MKRGKLIVFLLVASLLVTSAVCADSLKTGAQVKKDTTVKKSKGATALDWWTQASKIFRIGTTAKVTDVRTGKSFNIKRTYGYNHADCETLTSKDTKIMKAIWGGSWSWERRPVVVTVAGRRIAASIAAMPHAGVDSKPANIKVASRSGGFGRGDNLDKVKNNSMSGVFDVHFLHSRTHATNRVDGKHQAAVKKAVGK